MSFWYLTNTLMFWNASRNAKLRIINSWRYSKSLLRCIFLFCVWESTMFCAEQICQAYKYDWYMSSYNVIDKLNKLTCQKYLWSFYSFHPSIYRSKLRSHYFSHQRTSSINDFNCGRFAHTNEILHDRGACESNFVLLSDL